MLNVGHAARIRIQHSIANGSPRHCDFALRNNRRVAKARGRKAFCDELFKLEVALGLDLSQATVTRQITEQIVVQFIAVGDGAGGVDQQAVASVWQVSDSRVP